MPMTQEVIDALMMKSQPADVGTFVEHCKQLVEISRSQMAQYYDTWDRNDRIYRGEKTPDKADEAAAKRGGPLKFVVPVTYAQINTFVSFLLAVYNQRDYFYELGGTGVEDEKAAVVGQMLLEHNLEHNNFRHQKLKQFATDVAKYGVGIFKHSWVKETKTIYTLKPEQIPVPVGMEPVPPKMVPATETVTAYLGNNITTVSPYRFFPDPRLPLTRFQEGEFCASEDEYSRTQMQQFQRDGLAAGVDDIPELGVDAMNYRRKFSFQSDEAKNLDGKQKPYVILTELQVYLNPSEMMINGKPLGEENQKCLYLAWIANDTRLVRLERCDYPHQQFTYDCAQFEEDQIRFINDSMADKIGLLQDTIDWLINVRITNVRKVVGNQLVVDPKGIEIQDIRDRKPVLRLKPAVQGMGVDKWVKQLPIQDVTVNHLSDINFLDAFVKQTTGITENLLGQFASGRRSAQEARNVNNNATARITSVINALWDSALLPLGKKMLSNIRAGMDEAMTVRVIGQVNAQLQMEGLRHFFQVTPEMLVGDYDFLVFDGSLPSQRYATAQALQELLGITMSTPEAAFLFGYDPQALMTEILRLRGVRNAEQYRLNPAKAQQLVTLVQAGRNAMAPQPVTGAGGGPNVGGNKQPTG